MSTNRQACPLRGEAQPVGRGRTTAMAAYGIVVYVTFLAVLIYFIGWVEGLVVSRTIDEGLAASFTTAMLVDLAVLSVFAVQHSAMARPAFKRWWTRAVPAPVERSTYVLFATAALALVMSQWRPLPDEIWDVEPTALRAAIYAVSFVGWGMVLLSTFLIDHFDLFGLRQVLRHRASKSATDSAFVTPLLYRVVRHPLYLGFLIAFWAAPSMTRGRLLFAGVLSAYVLVAIRIEEHDLVESFGDRYRTYRRQTPMLIPRRPQQEEPDDATTSSDQ